MKTSTVLLISAVLFLTPLAVHGYSLDLEYGWDGGDLRVDRVSGFDYLGVEDCVFPTSTVGQIYRVELLPDGYRVEGHTVLREEWEELDGNYRLGVRSDGVMAVMMAEDQGGLEYVGSGDVLGYPVMVTAVKPFRIKDGKVSLLKRLEVRVECSTADDGLRPARRSARMEGHLRDLVAKSAGGSVDGYGDWDIQGYGDWITESPSLDGGVVDCVIVTADSMAAEFERLAAWHDKLGVRTVVRTMDWIESEYPGSDRAEQVRNFLRDAYRNWGTVYAVIGGAPPVVPIRYAWTNHYGGAFIPTDAYFAELKGSWNADGDHIFGEYGDPPEDPGDGVEFYAQMITGRAPVRTVEEAQTFVDKAIAYAAEPEPGFATSALFLGEVIFPVDWRPGDPITLDGGIMCDTAAAYFPADFDTVKLYQKYGDMTRTTCLDGFTTGYNFTVIAGHGDAFRTSAAEGDPPFISSTDFDTLSNDNRFGFIYALNCNNSAVDVDCVFRHFMLNPVGGGIGAYATTRYDFPNVGQFFLNEFLHFLFQRDVRRVGDVCALHHLMFIPSGLNHDGAVRWSLFTYILLGDPVMDFWVAEPETLEVSYGSLSLSDSVFSVEVSDGGVGVEGATVVLVGERGEYGIGVTGSDGIADVGYRPLGLGYVDVVASGRGYLVYEDSVEVTGSGGRLYVSSVSVDDGGGWVGNDDGEAGWGERVGLGVGLRNGDIGTLDDVSCEIEAVAGCSLYVGVDFDGVVSDSVIHVGEGCYHPGGLEFGLGVSEEVFGRCNWCLGEDSGCWIWLDASGWHFRFLGDTEGHSYRCSVEVYGELVGYSGHGLEVGDSLSFTGGELLVSGVLGLNDIEDGFDLAVGSGWDVVVHDGVESYGSVGSGEVLGWYDVEFSSLGAGDGLGMWFEASLSAGGGGSWRDWFRVDVHEGELVGSRLGFESLGGDTTGVYYEVHNVGGGGLRSVEGVLRGISGVEVCDSVVSYGDVCGGCYELGGMYRVRETGGPVLYEFEWTDEYGRRWGEEVEVRTVGIATGLGYRLLYEDLELYWSPSGDSVLLGYDVYRGETSGGPYELAGVVDGYSRYEDSGLSPEESYYYYVCARDSMGNVSAPSETLEAWTGSPYMPGWPTGPTDAMPSGVSLADVDGDEDLEIIVGSKDERLYMWHHDGSVAPGWPVRTGGEIWGAVAAVNFDADPELEILVGSDDGYLYAWNMDGTGLRLPSGKFRQTGGYVRDEPAVDDLDGDLDLEVVIGNSYGQLYVWHHDGTGYLQSNGLFAQCSGSFFGSPAIADIDGVEGLEIVAATGMGNIYVWHADGTGYLDSTGLFATTGAIFGSPAVGDVDNNGDAEIIVAVQYGRNIKVYDHDGTMHTGWPRSLDGDILVSPALAELDGDGKLDIIAAGYRGEMEESTSVYVFSDKGVIRPGWPKRCEADFFGSPVVGDISGDGEPDIVIAGVDGNIYAWHADGTPIHGWPRYFIYAFNSTPSLGDIDNDGDVEVVAAGYDAQVHVFDLTAAYDESSMHWPTMCHDLYNSGLYGGPSRAGVNPGVDEDIPVRLMLSGYPSPATTSVNIRLGVPSNAAAGECEIEVFDVRGRRVKQIYSGRLEPGFHEFTWDGTNQADRRVSSGIYFLRVNSGHASADGKVVLVR